MKTLVNVAGRDWNLRIDLGALERMLSMAGVDLLVSNLVDLLAHPTRCVLMVRAALHPQLVEQGVTVEQFNAAVEDDQTCQRMVDALAEEVVNFTRPPRRGTLEQTLAVLRRAEANLTEGARRLVESGALERLFEDVMRIPGVSSGNSPASAESPTSAP